MGHVGSGRRNWKVTVADTEIRVTYPARIYFAGIDLWSGNVINV
jgi:hypothetical protein